MTEHVTALVLAGGGSLGAVQVGMLKALFTQPLKIDLIVGSSVGALNGAFLASNPTAAGVERLSEIWLSLHRQDIFPVSLLTSLQALFFKKRHLIEAHALSQLIRTILPDQAVEALPIPLHIVTTNLLTGAEVVLSEGDVESCLLASTAIPVVFPPVNIGGQLLVDGSVASNTPIATAIAKGASRVLVLPTGFGCARASAPMGLAPVAMHALNILSMRQLTRDIEYHSANTEIIVLPTLCPLNVSVFDFSHTAELIERAFQLTAEWLTTNGLRPTGVPDALKPHHHPE